MKMSNARHDQPMDRAGPNSTSRLDEVRAKVACWPIDAQTSASTNLNHQDPLLHRHGSHPTANRTPLLVAFYESSRGYCGPNSYHPGPTRGSDD